VGDRELGLLMDVVLVAAVDLGGCGELRRELLAVVGEPVVGVQVGGVKAVEVEVDALGVGGVAGGVFAVQRSVVAKLRALVSVAPAELLGLGFEEGRAVGLVVCGLAVVVVFALESECVLGRRAVKGGADVVGDERVEFGVRERLDPVVLSCEHVAQRGGALLAEESVVCGR